MTLQRRISWALGALVALFVVAQGVLAYLSLEEQEDTLVDEIVLLETKRLVARVDSGELKIVPGIPEIALGGNFSAWLLAGDQADPASLPARVARVVCRTASDLRGRSGIPHCCCPHVTWAIDRAI